MADSEHVFLKVGDDKKIYRVESLKLADFVRVPVSDYVSVAEWNDLIEQNNVLAEKKNDADTVKISKEEYNGYENSIRIIRDRAKQQVDKAKTDEHGYTLLRADYKTYNYSRKSEKAWLVTKSTPHSIKIPLSTAKTLLKRDLEEFYRYVDYPVLEYDNGYGPVTKKLTASEIIKAHEQSNDEEYMEKYPDWLCENSDFGRNIKQFFDRVGGTDVAFEMSKISCNYAQGVYEVSYWATEPI